MREALADGGAAQIVVHARTKVEGYKPPAHWEWVARVQEAVKVPVFANGDIWNLDDWRRCREVSGVEDIMLGRGLVARRTWPGRLPPPRPGKTLWTYELGGIAAAAGGFLAAGAAQNFTALCAWAASNGWRCSPAATPRRPSCSTCCAEKAIACVSMPCSVSSLPKRNVSRRAPEGSPDCLRATNCTLGLAPAADIQ